MTDISYATWQDRQLAVMLARTGQLLRELREANLSAAGRNEEMAREIGRITALLEMREAELPKLSRQEESLVSDAQHWQAKVAALEKQVERQAALEAELQEGRRSLQKEVTRLSEMESYWLMQIRLITDKVNTSDYESAGLRRLIGELQSSLSWKITAPLRFLTKPLFRVMTPTAKPASRESAAAGAPVAAAPAAGPIEPVSRAANPLDAILPVLQRARSVAIIPCAIPFSATLNQRPISCAKYLADQGYTVLYVAWQWAPDEPVPNAWEEVYPHVWQLPLYGFQDNVDAIAAASSAKSAYVCTLASPALVEATRPLRAAGYHIHYDIMDDWEEFHRGGEAPWFSASLERELVVLADSVTAVSDRLAQKFAHLRSDIAVVRNGYQPAALGCEQFAAARTPLMRPKIVGYFGHFSDAWFDWDTVLYAAQKRPDLEFELIGWAISERTQARLKAFSNIRLPGIVPQKELHRYVNNWWAAMIPFRPSAVSAAVDPLKIYEYLHFGLNSVVTGITGIADYPLVHFAGDRESFVAALGRLPDKPDEQTLARVAEFLKACVWEERLALLNHMLRQPGLL